MPKNSIKASKTTSGGCLTLFGLPFFLAGLFITAMYFNQYRQWLEVQAWEKTPCQIFEVGMEYSNDSEGGTTQEVTARYGYAYEGRTYSGDRVSLYEGKDNIGSFHNRIHRELSSYIGRSGFECYVNPDNPEESILYNVLRWEMQCFMAIFALTFPAVGAGLVFGGLIGRRLEKQEKALCEAHPDEPWKHKYFWKEGTITQGVAWLWRGLDAYTIWAALVIAPMIAFIAASGAYSNQPLSWISMTFVAFWLVPARFSLKRWRNHRLGGQTYFRPSSMPYHPGETMEGFIVLQRMPYAQQEMEVTLECEKSYTVAGGDGDETHSEQIWDHRMTIPIADVRHDIDGYLAPVRISLPHDAPNSGDDPTQDKVWYAWNLSYKIAGTPIAGDFEIPVFGAPQSESQAEGMPPVASTTSPSIQDDAAEHLQLKLRDFHILSHFDEDNIPTSITCPACRRPGMVVFMFLFNVVWTLAAVWLVVGNAPLIFRIIWPVTATLIWVQILWMLLHKRVVTLSSHTIQVRNSLGPFFLNRRFDNEEIREFDFREAANSGNSILYNVRLLRRRGGKCVLVDNIRSSSSAKALVSQLEAWKQRGGQA